MYLPPGCRLCKLALSLTGGWLVQFKINCELLPSLLILLVTKSSPKEIHQNTPEVSVIVDTKTFNYHINPTNNVAFTFNSEESAINASWTQIRDPDIKYGYLAACGGELHLKIWCSFRFKYPELSKKPIADII